MPPRVETPAGADAGRWQVAAQSRAPAGLTGPVPPPRRPASAASGAAGGVPEATGARSPTSEAGNPAAAASARRAQLLTSITTSDQALFAATSEDGRGTAVTGDELVELDDLREELRLLRQFVQSGPSAAGPRGVAMALHGYGEPPRPSCYAFGPGGADSTFRLLSYDDEPFDAALKAAVSRRHCTCR